MGRRSDSSSDDDNVITWVKFACGAALLVFALVVGAYVYRFGSWPISSETDAWGQFGDYLGGTLNPFLGLFSVALLALTLRAQHRVLAETKQQGVLEEVQRLLSNCARDLDAALQRRLHGSDKLFAHLRYLEDAVAVAKWRAADGAPTVHSAVVAALLEIRFGQLSESARELFWEHPEIHWVFEKLGHLDRCLREFADRGGDPSIAKLYGSISQIGDPARLLFLLQRLRVLEDERYANADDSVRRLGIDSSLEVYKEGLAKCEQKLHRNPLDGA